MSDLARESVTHGPVYAGSARMRANLVALGTITRREVHRMLRIWTQTLVPPAITMTLYFVIFGKVIGSRVGPMHGFSYMQYIVPGLVMMSIINNSYGNITSSFFGSKFGRYVEEMLASPMPSWVVLTSSYCWRLEAGDGRLVVSGQWSLGRILSGDAKHVGADLIRGFCPLWAAAEAGKLDDCTRDGGHNRGEFCPLRNCGDLVAQVVQLVHVAQRDQMSKLVLAVEMG